MPAYEARPWFEQASSDLRLARLMLVSTELSEPLAKLGVELQLGDRGCHCAAMCSQTLEKSIKGYLLANGVQPKMDHRPDKYFPQLLQRNSLLLKRADDQRHLSRLFDPITKSVIKRLFDLTPGGLGKHNDLPNTEYPWTKSDAWDHAPVTADIFVHPRELNEWFSVSNRVHTELYRLSKSLFHGSLE